jgi:hypothetical protein
LQRLVSMTVMGAALLKKRRGGGFWNNMLSDVMEALKTEKSERKRKARERQAVDEGRGEGKAI